MENRNNEQPTQKRNVGMIVAAILVLICVIGIGVVLHHLGQDNDSKTADKSITEAGDIFNEKSYQVSDGSTIYFEEDGEFVWYQDDSNHGDNYYAGTFEVYLADDAEDYIVNELTDYGVTKEQLDDYYERNEESEIYREENFCCLVLHTEELIMEGKNYADESYDKHYMGFYCDGYYDAAAMDSGQYVSFTLIE